MLLCVVTTSYPSGADDPAGHFVQAEVEALRREGKHVVVMAPPGGGAFGWPGVIARLREHPARLLEAMQWVHATRREILRRCPDKIIAHWSVPCAWPLTLGSRASLEIVSHGADVRLLNALPERLRVTIVRDLVKRATTWRFVSESLRRELAEGLPPDVRKELGKKSVVLASPITLPVVPEDISKKRATVGERPLLVCVGRLIPSKEVERAIEYTKAQAAEASVPPVLVVVGDGPERQRLEALASTLGVDARFVGMLGRTDSLAWIGAADAVIHASRVEGLSTVVREAEALGVHVMRV